VIDRLDSVEFKINRASYGRSCAEPAFDNGARTRVSLRTIDATIRRVHITDDQHRVGFVFDQTIGR